MDKLTNKSSGDSHYHITVTIFDDVMKHIDIDLFADPKKLSAKSFSTLNNDIYNRKVVRTRDNKPDSSEEFTNSKSDLYIDFVEFLKKLPSSKVNYVSVTEGSDYKRGAGQDVQPVLTYLKERVVEMAESYSFAKDGIKKALTPEKPENIIKLQENIQLNPNRLLKE